jgi:2,4-dienoyl-CoA reductase-like NADH-dependent reductase (Old Yellow Enzyme family)
MSSQDPILQPFALRDNFVVRNRMVMAPMTNFSSHADGTVSEEEIAYYTARSGGVGMVITACAYVSTSGVGFDGEIGVQADRHLPGLRRLAETIEARGAKAILQIFHGGRTCRPDLVENGDVVGPSDVRLERAPAQPIRPLREEEILSIVQDFGEATRRAIKAGFSGVEIHGANGYLLQQFFSVHTNRRTDDWGGDLQRRMRFPLAVLEEVQRTVALHADRPFIVGYRFSPEEADDDGITLEDTFALTSELAKRKPDYLHVSLSDFWSRPRRAADIETPRVLQLQRHIGHLTPLMAVGSIHTPDEARLALATGVPLLALGREIVVEPEWVEKVASNRTNDIRISLTKQDRETLVVPEPLWNSIVNTPGWFPVSDEVKCVEADKSTP